MTISLFLGKMKKCQKDYSRCKALQKKLGSGAITCHKPAAVKKHPSKCQRLKTKIKAKNPRTKIIYKRNYQPAPIAPNPASLLDVRDISEEEVKETITITPNPSCTWSTVDQLILGYIRCKIQKEIPAGEIDFRLLEWMSNKRCKHEDPSTCTTCGVCSMENNHNEEEDSSADVIIQEWLNPQVGIGHHLNLLKFLNLLYPNALQPKDKKVLQTLGEHHDHDHHHAHSGTHSHKACCKSCEEGKQCESKSWVDKDEVYLQWIVSENRNNPLCPWSILDEEILKYIRKKIGESLVNEQTVETWLSLRKSKEKGNSDVTDIVVYEPNPVNPFDHGGQEGGLTNHHIGTNVYDNLLNGGSVEGHNQVTTLSCNYSEILLKWLRKQSTWPNILPRDPGYLSVEGVNSSGHVDGFIGMSLDISTPIVDNDFDDDTVMTIKTEGTEKLINKLSELEDQVKEFGTLSNDLSPIYTSGSSHHGTHDDHLSNAIHERNSRLKYKPSTQFQESNDKITGLAFPDSRYYTQQVEDQVAFSDIQNTQPNIHDNAGYFAGTSNIPLHNYGFGGNNVLNLPSDHSSSALHNSINPVVFPRGLISMGDEPNIGFAPIENINPNLHAENESNVFEDSMLVSSVVMPIGPMQKKKIYC